MITWKLFWTTLAATATLVAGAVLRALTPQDPNTATPNEPLTLVEHVASVFTLGYDVVVTTALLLAAAIVVTTAAKAAILGAQVFEHHPHHLLKRYVHAIGGAATLHALWIVAFMWTPGHLPILLAALTTLATAEHATATLLDYLHKRRPHLPPDPPDDDRPTAIMKAALNLAKLNHVTVTDWTPLHDDTPDTEPFGIEFGLQVPPHTTTTLTGTSERLAIALSHKTILNTPLETRWVQIHKRPTAGQYGLYVVLRDINSDVIPYHDTPEWTTIGAPALVGRDYGRKPLYLTLKQHGQHIGKTDSGKTSLINVEFAHLTRCRDAIIWVCGVEKVYDFLAGWLDPYHDTDETIPFDWIANGPQDSLTMLIALMNVVRYRQRLPMNQRNNLPHITLYLDEAADLLQSKVTALYRGEHVTSSQMFAKLARTARSANCWLKRASQRDTHDHGGDFGGDTSANMGYTAAFKSKDWAAIGRLMNDFDLAIPKNRGECWFDIGTGDPVLGKALYIQEIDPNREKLHNGVTLAEVSWSRRHFPRHLDPGSAEAAGPAYTNRHTHMNNELLTYLTQEPDTPTITTATQQGYDDVMNELNALLPDIPQLATKRSRADRITDIITTSEQPISPQEILTALHATDDATATTQVVTNALTKLVTEGRVIRVERGRYETPKQHTSPGGVDAQVNAPGP